MMNMTTTIRSGVPGGFGGWAVLFILAWVGPYLLLAPFVFIPMMVAKAPGTCAIMLGIFLVGGVVLLWMSHRADRGNARSLPILTGNVHCTYTYVKDVPTTGGEHG